MLNIRPSIELCCPVVFDFQWFISLLFLCFVCFLLLLPLMANKVVCICKSLRLLVSVIIPWSGFVHHDSYRTSPTVVYDFDNADYDSIPHYILNNPFLSSYPMGETVDQVWENFVKPLNDAIHLFVPTKVICTRSSKKAKWYPRHNSPSACQKTPTLEILPQKHVDRGQKSIW